MKKILIIILSIALIAGCTNNPAEIPDNDVQEAIDEAQETNDETQDTDDETKDTKEPVIAPDFELASMDGSVIKLSETRDKNVILNFWYTGCVFCVTEMPDLQKLQETYPDDLLLLAINVGESKEVIEDFMDENNLSFIVLQDEDMLVAYDYGIRSFPTTIAINKKGEVVGGYIGMLTYEQMEQLYGLFE
ncbi:MAG TPA: hypothetical protein DIV40_07695 [Clostridiales bacterium]|jgi:thiol-disulfide isomerase/thioredoxin|nr:hypothetical protein [Clostridiales bacterium]